MQTGKKSWGEMHDEATFFIKDHVAQALVSVIGLYSVHWNRSAILTATQRRDSDGGNARSR